MTLSRAYALYRSAILVAKEAAAMASGSGAGPGLVGIAKSSGWMVAKIYLVTNSLHEDFEIFLSRCGQT